MKADNTGDSKTKPDPPPEQAPVQVQPSGPGLLGRARSAPAADAPPDQEMANLAGAKRAAERAVEEAAKEAVRAAHAAKAAVQTARKAADEAAEQAALASTAADRAQEAAKELKAVKTALAAKEAALRAAEKAAERAAQVAAKEAAHEAAEKAAVEREAAEREAEEAAREAARIAAEREAREAAEREALKAAEEAAREADRLEAEKAAKEAEAARIAEADRKARAIRAARAARAQEAARSAKFARRAAERSAARGHRRKRRRFNRKLAIALAASLLVAVLGVYGTHAYQVKTNAKQMKARAEAAEKAGDTAKAIRDYRYYTEYVPRDDEAVAALALLVAGRAEKSNDPHVVLQAFRTLGLALQRNEKDEGLLRKHADFAMKVRRMNDAEGSLKELIKKDSNDTDLKVQLGRCQVAQSKTREARATFEKVIGEAPHNIDAYVELADLLIGPEMDDRDSAEALMNQMVRNNPKSPRAYLERARFKRKVEDLAEAKKDISKAMERDPDDVEILLTAADLAMDEKDFDQARDHLNRARDLHADDLRVHQALAVLNVNIGKTDEAIEHLEEAVEKQPDDPLMSLLSLADLQLRQGDVEAVRHTISRMEEAGFRPELLDFFRARVEAAEGRWRQAADMLELLRTQVTGLAEFRTQVELFLGACYEQLRMPDRQLEMFRSVLDEDPTLTPARLGYASALYRTGKLDRAAEQYQRLEETLGTEEFLKNAAARGNLFHLIVARTEMLPETERDWKELEEFLDKLDSIAGVDTVQKTLMRAELLVKKDQISEARKLVTAARDENATEAPLWIALAKLTALEDGAEQGLLVLDEAGVALEERLPIRLAKADLATQLPGAEARAKLSELAADAENLPETAQASMWQTLGACYYRIRDRNRARQFWLKAVEADPGNVPLRMILFELARESGDEGELREAAGEVEDLLGVRSAEAMYCEASRLVWLAQKGRSDEASLARAKQLLKTAAEARPNWHEIPRVEAQIALLEGKLDDAIERFQYAADLGPLSPIYLGQLVRLLYVRGRYDEARDVMLRLHPQRVSLTMRKLEAELSFRTGDLDQAVALAEKTIEDSDRATDFLWYGQLLSRAGRNAEAQEACRHARDLDPTIPEAWMGLVALLVDAGDKDQALDTVRDARAQLPEDRAPLVLARCYEMLGDAGEAERWYKDAVSFARDDLAVLRSVARFYLRTGQGEEAGKYLDQLRQAARRDPERNRDDLEWARRALAQLLHSRGQYDQLQTALSLLDRNARDGKLDTDDLRLKAFMLASRPERTCRLEALKLYEEVRQDRKTALTPRERLTLVDLYEKGGRRKAALKEIESLVSLDPDNAALLATLANMLLRRRDPIEPVEEIEPWVEKLEAVQPGAAPTVAARARLLVRRQRADDAVKLLTSLIPDPLPREKAGILRDVAGLLEELGQPDAAQPLLDRFARQTPGGQLALAGLLGRQGKLTEALDQCEEALDEVPVTSVVPAAISILHAQHGKLTPEAVQRVDDWLQQGLADAPNSKDLLLQLSELRHIQGRYDDLPQLYRDFLDRDDTTTREKALIWNNLAFVLAAGGTDPQEADNLISKAIDVLGPSAELLDTRGVVQVANNRPQQAVEDLRTAIAESPSGVSYFHLAMAQHAAGDRQGAAASLNSAMGTYRLTEAQIPAIERPKFRELVGTLKVARR